MITPYRTPWYTVTIDERHLVATVTGLDGRLWTRLRLLSSVDCLDGPDETATVTGIEVDPTPDGLTVTVTAASSRWSSRRTVLRCGPDAIAVRTEVTGRGRPTAVHLLGGWYPPRGFLPSGSGLGTVLSPNPDHPSRLARPAVAAATVGVVGEGSEPGVGRWLFTPAPWCLAVHRDRWRGPDRLPADGWLALGIAPRPGGQNFTQLHYLPVTDGFSLRLDYEGHTGVSGRFEPPEVLLLFGPGDAYLALERHRTALADRGLVPGAADPGGPTRVADWWRQPMFCGWGAQCERAHQLGVPASTLSTQDEYDRYLGVLAAQRIHPGTVTVDDKWQSEYARCRPDPARWPDLRSWIARRHAAGQRVLLWWKAWDPEGAPAAACVRDLAGRPVALDPDTPQCRALIGEAVEFMLAPSGLAADGLKIDFTARTPSGTGLRHHGPHWGAELLHRQLSTVYQAAKRARPDALIITHTPNPAFVDVTDMIRLNDAMMLDAPDPYTRVVDQMSYRARVVAAACPGLPVDTDGWAMPDRAQFREWLAAAPALGVPSLYHADRVAGEPLTAIDHALIRRTWADHRARCGLAEPVPDTLQS